MLYFQLLLSSSFIYPIYTSYQNEKKKSYLNSAAVEIEKAPLNNYKEIYPLLSFFKKDAKVFISIS